MKQKATFAGALAVALMLFVHFTSAQTVIEQAAEHRFQIDFRVNDAALAKLLPPGWETVIATQGPAKDCNLRMIFIDRMAVMADGGKTATPHTARLSGDSGQGDGHQKRRADDYSRVNRARG